MYCYEIEKSKEYEMTGYCGIYCEICECAKAKDDPKLLERLISIGIDADKLPCLGCRFVKGKCPVRGDICMIYKCAKERNVSFCYECELFPCEKLIPVSDKEDVTDHNLKVYNLCYIQNQGLEKFAKNAEKIKKKYYKGEKATANDVIDK